MEPIRLHFAYTPTDIYRAYRLYQRRSGRSLREKIYAMLMLFAAVGSFFLCDFPLLQYGFQLGFGDYLRLLIFLLLAIVFWFDLASVLGRWVGQRKRKNEPPVLYDLSFDDSGAHYSTATVDAKLAWTEFRTVYEDQYSFLLMLKADKKQYWAIPRQYFASARELDEFRRLLEAHIPPP